MTRIAADQRLKRGLLSRILERDDPRVREPAILRCLGRRADLGRRESGERGLVVYDERAVLCRGEQPVGELRRERGHFRVERLEPRLVGR